MEDFQTSSITKADLGQYGSHWLHLLIKNERSGLYLSDINIAISHTEMDLGQSQAFSDA